jgi:hypothetical protein
LANKGGYPLTRKPAVAVASSRCKDCEVRRPSATTCKEVANSEAAARVGMLPALLIDVHASSVCRRESIAQSARQ